ncbi:MAG: phosphoribosyltransferase [Actinomycetota bacterium]|jgi:putative phosphoribosyl transferase|nr:phosphoribosyltransferase [Actinomycetota bacterium]
MGFRDRTHAGRVLGELLRGDYAGSGDLLVLGLPRGGVPVAFEVAQELGAELDVFVVRKLGVPGHEELAMGALASGGIRVLNDTVVAELEIGEVMIARAAATESAELERRERAYRGDRAPVEASGRTVLLVDDGLATGSTMRAAALAVRAQDPERLVVAVPVAAEQTCDEFRADVDEIVCAFTPEPFHAVGLWYEDFAPTSDDEVRELLARAAAAPTQ